MNKWTTWGENEGMGQWQEKEMEGEMGNQSVDLLWSTREKLGQAETKITETTERVLIGFHRSRDWWEEDLEVGKIEGKKLLQLLWEEKHAGRDSGWIETKVQKRIGSVLHHGPGNRQTNMKYLLTECSNWQ